jgi:hypothetical protein
MARAATTLIALLFLSAIGLAGARADEPGPPTPVDPAAFYAAKAAAGGVLDAALEELALSLAKQDVHAVQLYIERFGVDHLMPSAGSTRRESHYPQHVNQLLLGNPPYAQPGLYANPFTAGAADELDAQEVPFGWTPQSPGNFSYLQWYDEHGGVLGYMLVLWGPRDGAGLDLSGDGKGDGVAMTLLSGAQEMRESAPLEFYSGGRKVVIAWGR